MLLGTHQSVDPVFMIVELDLSRMNSTCKCHTKYERTWMVLEGRRCHANCSMLVLWSHSCVAKYRHVFTERKLRWSWCAGSEMRNLISFERIVSE